MSAELRKLIKMYRRNGLDTAADHLEIDRIGMEAKGILPERVRRLSDVFDEGVSKYPQTIMHGHVYLVDTAFAVPAGEYEIDSLGLPARARHALLSAGFTTISSLEYGNDNSMLHLVQGLGRKSIRRIATVLERPWPYLMSLDVTYKNLERKRRRP